MSTMKVLVIEDDQGIVEAISLAFQIRWPEAKLISTHLANHTSINYQYHIYQDKL